MARACRHNLRAVFGALVVMLMPHTGFADPSAINLSDLRRALSTVEADVKNGITAPVNIAEIWAQLPLQSAVPTAVADTISPQPVIPKPVTTQFTAPKSVIAEPDEGSAKPASPDGGLFSLQLSQTAESPIFTPPSPAQQTQASTPLFGLQTAFGTAATANTQTNTPKAVAPVKLAPQDVSTANFRQMLTPLLQAFTGENAQAVINAQGPRGPLAVSVRAGSVTLADIQSYSAALGMPPLPDGTLTAPVVVWPGASLRLSPGERMALSTSSGAFLLSMGNLAVNGATIEAVGPPNPHTPSFLPFVTVTGGGALQMKNATLRGLGFGNTAKFSGLSIAANLLNQTEGKVTIEDSLFDSLKTLSIAGVSGAVLSGNTFINARNNTVNLLNAPRTRVTQNLFTGGSHTNAIRIDKGSSKSLISDNLMVFGERVAILVNGASDSVIVRRNLIWKRRGAGIKFLRTRCGLAEGNLVLDNRQKGVEVRKSDGTAVRNNLIAGNGSAAIWVSAQQPNARTALNDNRLAGNGSGLSTATGAEIFLADNNFAAQLPRLLDGDIARLTHNIVKDLHGKQHLVISNGGAEIGGPLTALCGSTL